MDINAALNQFDSWPVEDRINFIEAAWDRLVASGYEPELTPEQLAELDDRIENPGEPIPWEQVKAELRRKK